MHSAGAQCNHQINARNATLSLVNTLHSSLSLRRDLPTCNNALELREWHLGYSSLTHAAHNHILRVIPYHGTTQNYFRFPKSIQYYYDEKAY